MCRKVRIDWMKQVPILRYIGVSIAVSEFFEATIKIYRLVNCLSLNDKDTFYIDTCAKIQDDEYFMVMKLCILLIELVTAALLIVGILHRALGYMLPWIVASFMGMMGSVLTLVETATDNIETTGDAIHKLFQITLHVTAWSTVCLLFKLMLKKVKPIDNSVINV